METNKPECVIIGGLFAGSFALCLMASSGWHWLTGFTFWGVAETLRTRRKLEYVEVFRGCAGYTQDLIGEVNDAALPVSTKVGAMQRSLTVAALKQLPMGDRIADQFIAAQGLDAKWFEGFERRSAIVCGESGDGKSFLLQWRVARYLESHPEGELLICDPDYGSSHDGAKPNDWFKLPVGKVVQIEPDEISSAIAYVSGEVTRRAQMTSVAVKAGKQKPSFKPLLLVIDEWGSFWDSLTDEHDAVLANLTNIVNRGIKQGSITFILGTHDMSVGSTGLPQALQRKLECVFLYRAAVSARNYQGLEAPKDQVSAAIARMGKLPCEVRGLRPCVVWSNKELTVKAVPTLELANITFTTSEVDEDEAWLEQVWTADLAATVAAKLSDRLNAGKTGTGIKELWVLAGAPGKAVNENRKYLMFKSKIDTLYGRLQSAQKDGTGNQLLQPGTSEPADIAVTQEAFDNPFSSKFLD